MKVKTILKQSSEFPGKLQTIASPPKEIGVLGNIQPLSDGPVVSVVGSRSATPYGRQVTIQLVKELAARGVAIVSGLALGIDSIAHQAALEAKGYTAAVLPSPVDDVYPASHRRLAQQILASGGALISEYSELGRPEAFKSRFIERNRLVAGLADALLITEAGERSGTLHTANFALDQGKTVLCVPGNITSPLSLGTNNLIKSGAVPVTDIKDILQALGLSEAQTEATIYAANDNEAAILEVIRDGVTDSAILLSRSGLSTSQFNQTLTMLEITGKIRPLGAGHWALN
jgi:DNA processing protein